MTMLESHVLRRLSAGALALLGIAWLAAAEPARAEGAKSDAREACEELMEDRNFKDVDVQDVDKKKGDRVIVESEATRRGNDRSVDCVYNAEKDKAFIRK